MHLVNYLSAFKYSHYNFHTIAVPLAMPDLKSNQNWFIKYKLYHIPFWLFYNYIWWMVVVGDPKEAASEILFTPFSVKFLFYVIFQILAVLFNLYYLMPRFLENGKNVKYLSLLTLTILVTAVLIVPGYYLSAYFYGSNVQKVYGVSRSYGYFQLFRSNPIQSTLGCITLSMSIKLTKNWIQTKKRQQALEKEKLETELKFLKYQFNPHFLFNSINSIFFLIHKNPDMASASLAKFSELLRHQLYECNDNQIPLSKEIAYLENFIELEKLRQNPDLKVNFDVSQDYPDNLGISPFILMTFVENAFKHVSKHKGWPNWINIKLDIASGQLSLNVTNSTAEEHIREVINYGGIGLKNVQRRLDLLYPGQYELDIKNNPDNFIIELNLQLSELIIYPTAQLIA
jgi:two-component system LytT family sensor kinase